MGSIVGIWPHDDQILIGKTGRDMIGACCSMYGPRTTCIYYNDISKTVEEIVYLGF